MFENEIEDLEEFRDMLFYLIQKNGFEAIRTDLKKSKNPAIKICGESEEILVIVRNANEKQYVLTKKEIRDVISKVALPPHSINNDSLAYRKGYIKALLELRIINDEFATGLFEIIEDMEGWEE